MWNLYSLRDTGEVATSWYGCLRGILLETSGPYGKYQVSSAGETKSLTAHAAAAAGTRMKRRR